MDFELRRRGGPPQFLVPFDDLLVERRPGCLSLSISKALQTRNLSASRISSPTAHIFFLVSRSSSASFSSLARSSPFVLFQALASMPRISWEFAAGFGPSWRRAAAARRSDTRTGVFGGCGTATSTPVAESLTFVGPSSGVAGHLFMTARGSSARARRCLLDSSAAAAGALCCSRQLEGVVQRHKCARVRQANSAPALA